MSVGMDRDTDTAPLTVPSGEVPSPPARHTARWVGVFVLVIAAGLVAVLATRPSAQTTESNNPLVGQFAPAIAGATVNGTTFRLPKAPGHYVVVNFFASWCVPCQEETPELIAFGFQHRPTISASPAGIATVVSVIYNDTTLAARLYQQKLGVTWPTMVDANQSIAINYGVHADPSTFLIAPNGRVVAYIPGGVTAKGLNALIARAEASGYGA